MFGKLTNSVKSVSSKVITGTNEAKGAVSSLLFDEKESNGYEHSESIPNNSFLKYKKGQLCLRFWRHHMHWGVLVFPKNDDSSTKYCTKIHFVGYVDINSEELRPNSGRYKDHIIYTRRYADIIRWSRNYCTTHPGLKFTSDNCRKFTMRFAEYCNISINEIDKTKIGSQYYSVTDFAKDTKKVRKNEYKNGKIITGTAKIVGSAGKNSAKIGVATLNQGVNTTKNTVVGAFKLITK